MDTTWECIVVGGGAAGLSAALVLGRARRRTLVIDGGDQSNLVAHGIGGLLGHDGRPPAELYAAGRRELAAYPSVEVRSGQVVGGERCEAGFVLELSGGVHEAARRVLLATGMDYRLPDLPGIGERWGRSVFHCPFCHGWEMRDQPLGVLDRGATGARRALLLRQWSEDVTLLTSGPAELQDDDEQRLRRLAIVGGLAAGVAHEINNPLAAITTCAEAINRDIRRAAATQEAHEAIDDQRHAPTLDMQATNDDDAHLTRIAAERNWKFYLEEIVRQALRCKAITGGLLDLARERRARLEAVDVNRTIEMCARVFAESASGRVRFRTEPDAHLTPLLTDESMLRQILDNLVSNALHAIAQQPAEQDGEVILTTRADGAARVIVEVSDTGAGIAPENLARIFDPFWTTKHTGHGVGLGLAVCQTLAESLGGRLTVESKSGAGSRFRLWIPRK